MRSIRNPKLAKWSTSGMRVTTYVIVSMYLELSSTVERTCLVYKSMLPGIVLFLYCFVDELAMGEISTAKAKPSLKKSNQTNVKKTLLQTQS